jgi:hypothetical protein
MILPNSSVTLPELHSGILKITQSDEFVVLKPRKQLNL